MEMLDREKERKGKLNIDVEGEDKEEEEEGGEEEEEKEEEEVGTKIINEVKGINRVVYDITNKAPGTIEWE